jgi:tRNA threonylcarbamoyl adenosine modification protein YeaZ
VVARVHEVLNRGHAERLVPMIAELPDGGRAERIAVDCGPGSFTGVRVGVAAARGLGLGWGVPVHGYSSTSLLAAAALATDPRESLAAALEAGHGEVFMQVFDSSLATLLPLASLKPEAAVAALAGLRVVGNGVARLLAVDPRLDAAEALPDAADWLLLPPALADLAPRPIYGRAPDAKLPSHA